ncbi:DDE Tnp4 domain-containing protein [Aphis craccivora]|uniref:DDE Tnp4 domain-containing protein n=1 Tax=Aphis craccivora TaxID=307492 RepID=A0A6G0W5F7_APHCR|nr:DDE Tnp4 domain-containing protein [Aphis craccivora]
MAILITVFITKDTRIIILTLFRLFLATGNSFRSISFSFRLDERTVRRMFTHAAKPYPSFYSP